MIMANSMNSSNAPVQWCKAGIVMKSALRPGKLSICCANSQSICARKLSKLHELKQILSISKVFVVCISETWLNELLPLY